MILIYTHKNSVGHFYIIHIKDNKNLNKYLKKIPLYINNLNNYYYL